MRREFVPLEYDKALIMADVFYAQDTRKYLYNCYTTIILPTKSGTVYKNTQSC